jgi:hypothetical protein
MDMKFSVGRWVQCAAMTLIVWSIAGQSLWAQAPGQQHVDKSYGIQYFLVILGCALGLLIVCRSANRTTDIKRTDD